MFHVSPSNHIINQIETTKKKKTIYCYNKLRENEFRYLLEQVDWTEILLMHNIDDSAQIFTKKLLDLASKCMPVKTITIRTRDNPWMTEEIKT